MNTSVFHPSPAPVSASIDTILAVQRRMGYQYARFLYPAATAEEISAAEQAMGFSLNAPLRDLYQRHNGGNYAGQVDGHISLFPIYHWISLEEAIGEHRLIIDAKLKDAFYSLDEHYQPGPNMFPFLSNGAGSLYWVDLNPGRWQGHIYWTDTDLFPKHVCPSLEVFLTEIAHAYQQRVFFLDKDGYLDVDQDRWRY